MTASAGRVLLCLFPGLGDALTASPVIRILRAAGAQVDVLALLDTVAAYASSLADVQEVLLVPLFGRLSISSAAVLLSIRKRRYDLVVLPFPATRWQYALVARLAASRMLVAHRYGGASDLIARLGGHALVELMGGHRTWENVRLVSDAPPETDVSYVVPRSWRSATIPGTLGIHPGTMKYKGNEVRRWPPQLFMELAVRNLARGRRVRIFLGPCESTERDAFCALSGAAGCELVEETIASAAQKLSECEVFVGNDAGFAHLASGLGVKTIVLFGMTSPSRALPIGPAMSFRPSGCPPCHDEGLGQFGCVKRARFRCINDISLGDVDHQVERAFTQSIPEHVGVRSSPFRLYDRWRATAQGAGR